MDTIGWIGSVLLVIAYWLVSQNKVSPTSFQYQMANIIGSICLLIHTFFYGAYPSSVLNLIWASIGLFYFIKNKRTNVRMQNKKSK